MENYMYVLGPLWKTHQLAFSIISANKESKHLKNLQGFNIFYALYGFRLTNEELRFEGVGIFVKQAEPITEDEEMRLWDLDILGYSWPQWSMCGLYFALWSGDKHRHLHPDQFQLHKPTTENCAYIVSPLKQPSPNWWHSKVFLGHNTLSKVVKWMCDTAGITGHKTNHSLCATAGTCLLKKGVVEQMINMCQIVQTCLSTREAIPIRMHWDWTQKEDIQGE